MNDNNEENKPNMEQNNPVEQSTEVPTNPVEENKPVEANNQTEEKKDGSTLGTIFGFIFLGMLVVGFLFMGKFNEFVNEHFPNIGRTVGIDKDDTVQTVTPVFNPVGYYTKNNSILILRDDDTFVYDDDTTECYDPLVGVYDVDGSVLTLTGKTYYGCDSCYYKNGAGIRTISMQIINNKIMYQGEFAKTSNEEDSSSIYKYIVSPENGTIPRDNNESWIFCE